MAVGRSDWSGELESGNFKESGNLYCSYYIMLRGSRCPVVLRRIISALFVSVVRG